VDQLVQIRVGLAQFLNFADGVQHSGVMLATEVTPDLG
jgi:hypothetical protein